MCDAIRYLIKNQQTFIRFDDSNPALPVRLKNGRYQHVHWGNKSAEDPFPLGGTAHIDQINAGEWDSYQPKPVKIAFEAYMQVSIQGEICWFELGRKPNTYLQGLLAVVNNMRRVYVVVKNAESFNVDKHEALPVMIYQPESEPLRGDLWSNQETQLRINLAGKDEI